MKLTTKARAKLPLSKFAEPKEKAYPIEDRAHAINALARVSEYGTAHQKEVVRKAVNRNYPKLEKKTK